MSGLSGYKRAVVGAVCLVVLHSVWGFSAAIQEIPDKLALNGTWEQHAPNVPNDTQVSSAWSASLEREGETLRGTVVFPGSQEISSATVTAEVSGLNISGILSDDEGLSLGKFEGAISSQGCVGSFVISGGISGTWAWLRVPVSEDAEVAFEAAPDDQVQP